MLKNILYISVFICLLWTIQSNTFQVLYIYHGYIESIFMTIGVMLIFEITERKFEYIQKISTKQLKRISLISYLSCLGFLLFMISNLTYTEEGTIESNVLYTFHDFHAWSGYESVKFLKPWVGIFGFVLTILIMIQVKSDTFLQKNIIAKIQILIPVLLYYILLCIRFEYISIIVFEG